MATFALCRPGDPSVRWVFSYRPRTRNTMISVANYSGAGIFLPWMDAEKGPHTTNTLRQYTLDDARKLWGWLVNERYIRATGVWPVP